MFLRTCKPFADTKGAKRSTVTTKGGLRKRLVLVVLFVLFDLFVCFVHAERTSWLLIQEKEPRQLTDQNHGGSDTEGTEIFKFSVCSVVLYLRGS